MIDVYVAGMCKNPVICGIYPDERRAYIENISDGRLKIQKISSWELLQTAVKQSLGYDFYSLVFSRSANGKWLCDKFYFSLSHTADKVAVALSDKPVGVDIEMLKEFSERCKKSPAFAPSLAKKILCEGESASGEEELLKLWTAKESVFKAAGTGAFVPAGIRVSGYPVATVMRGGYCLSVCGEGAEKSLAEIREIHI